MTDSRKFDLSPRNGIPDWMVRLRAAAFDSIKEADIKEIVANQVKRAKEGDPQAVKLIFDYLLGGKPSAQQVPSTLTQNNVVIKTSGKPGTKKKLRAMQERAANGLPLHSEDDPAFGSED